MLKIISVLWIALFAIGSELPLSPQEQTKILASLVTLLLIASVLCIVWKITGWLEPFFERFDKAMSEARKRNQPKGNV
jgi:hypothetical protein